MRTPGWRVRFCTLGRERGTGIMELPKSPGARTWHGARAAMPLAMVGNIGSFRAAARRARQPAVLIPRTCSRFGCSGTRISQDSYAWRHKHAVERTADFGVLRREVTNMIPNKLAPG